MAAAHEQWQAYEILAKACNYLGQVKELSSEVSEQDVSEALATQHAPVQYADE